MRVYILVCVGKGKNALEGKPVVGTFGVFRSMREAMAERERVQKVPNHFADEAEWIVSIDELGA